MIQGIWDEFLKLAKEEAGSRIVDTWFRAIVLQHWDALEKVVYLKAPNQFVKNWITTKYIALFQIHLGRLLNTENPKIVFLDSADEKITGNGYAKVLAHAPKENPGGAELVPVAQEKKRALVSTAAAKKYGYTNRSYLFESFIVGPSNSLAYAAAHAVTEKPGNLYNPLFIYGGSGLGKTHLLHAIGNAIKERNQNAVVLYQTADRFVNEFISAIRFDKIHKFQAKYRAVDVLLVDDIQFISHKEQTQEAFFHIFNSLYDAHKQIVFSSDTFPQNIEGIAERLRSRLGWGLVTDIYVPSIETKIVILKKKAEMNGYMLSDDVAHFIASRSVSNIRELEGAFIRVMAFASLTKQEISLELAQKVLIRSSEQELRSVDFDRIIKVITKHYSYKLDELRSKNRNKQLAFVRQLAMFMMKKFTDKSLREIGIFLGGRDHSTVLHAIDKVEKNILDQPELQEKIRLIEKEIPT